MSEKNTRIPHEVIVKLTSDRIKVKGGEYVRDLVRCRECKDWSKIVEYGMCDHFATETKPDDFCSYGEVRDE